MNAACLPFAGELLSQGSHGGQEPYRLRRRAFVARPLQRDVVPLLAASYSGALYLDRCGITLCIKVNLP